MLGAFREDARTRTEFLELIARNRRYSRNPRQHRDEHFVGSPLDGVQAVFVPIEREPLSLAFDPNDLLERERLAGAWALQHIQFRRVVARRVEQTTTRLRVPPELLISPHRATTG